MTIFGADFYLTMVKQKAESTKKRLAGAYLSSLISISLVLALVGLSTFLAINARNVSDYFKESLQVSVLMKTDVGNDSAEVYKAYADSLNFVKSARVVTKEEGTEELKAMLGDDFLDVFEMSPVPVSVDVTLKAEYVSPDSLAMVTKALAAYDMVEEVSCQQSLVEALNANMARISLVLGIFILLLLFVSFILIGNTVRVNLFAKRFTIHTMKLVGATRGFISAPFIRGAILQGVLSSAIATGLLYGLLRLGQRSFAALFAGVSTESYLMVAAAVLLTGVLICTISTFFTVGRLISLDKDELYY